MRRALSLSALGLLAGCALFQGTAPSPAVAPPHVEAASEPAETSAAPVEEVTPEPPPPPRVRLLAPADAELPATAAWAAHDRFATAGEIQAGDSLFAARDLLSYSQSYRRHACIKDNCFSALPRTPEALIGADEPTPAQLLERWTDATVDPARLRTLEQMVASEGLVATLFYRLATAGPAAGDETLPDPARYAAFFDAFAAIRWEHGAPTVLEFLQRLLEAAEPDERPRIARTALEVFHYVGFVDGAAAFHRDLLARGHRMEMGAFREAVGGVAEARSAAVDRLVGSPDWLSRVAAPPLWVTVPEVEVAFTAFGMPPAPLVLDVNSAPIEFLLALPGVG